MKTTRIDTSALPRLPAKGGGEFAEILNRELCGAENVNGLLRWLAAGDRFVAAPLEATHQLIYLMEGQGSIALNGQDYAVSAGAGIYLAPGETAEIAQRGEESLKLFQLVVPIRPELTLNA